MFKVTCTQIVEELSNADDRDELPAGPYGLDTQKEYTMSRTAATTLDEALDYFHATVPIGCLDDFEIEAFDLSPLGKSEDEVNVETIW